MKAYFEEHSDYFLRLAVTFVLAAVIYFIAIHFTSSSFLACFISVVVATYLRIILLELLQKRREKK